MRQPTELIGREREVEALRQALTRGRLVTVTGPSGVGKSALVRYVLGDRALYCSLSAVRGPEELLRALGDTLGLAPARATPEPTIARALGRKDQDVVLDGADRAQSWLRPWLPKWLRACPSAHFVVSAQSRLGLEQELLVPLSPPSLEPALRLWMDATARLGHESAPEVARQLVERLDRLPLALVWWASRAALLGDQACLDRLQRFAPGDDPLASALQASLEALDEAAERALELVAMFERGLPVAALGQAGIELSCLEQLVDRTLVRIERDAGAAARAQAYRPVVAHLRAEARTSGRWDELARKHASIVLGLGEAISADPKKTQGDLAQLRAELEAIAERFAEVDPALGLRACLLACPLAQDDGTAEQAVTRLTGLISRSPQPPANAWVALGALERKLGRLDRAREHLLLAQAQGESFEALIELGHVDRMQSLGEAALQGYEAALALATASGDAARKSVGLGELGRMLQSMGRYRDAQQHHQEAIALERSLGLVEREALERSLHARATHRAGDVREAIPLHEQALAMHLELGQRRLAAAERGHLGFCKHELGELAEAEALFRQSVDGLADVGDVALECIERTLLARLLIDQERVAEAKLELAIVETVTTELAMPRVELTMRFVAGLGAWCQGDLLGAEQHFEAAVGLGLHLEVGFEALLPAHLAVVRSVLGKRNTRAPLERSTELVRRIDTPGVRAALAVLAAAVRGTKPPELPTELVASSSDARRALRLLERAGARPALRLTKDGRRVELPDGSTFDFGRSAAPRRLLLALAQARLAHPGAVLGPEDLIAAGWPNERMRPDAARQRLRTAIWTLRKLGLEPMLLTREEGYLLDPATPLVWRS